MKFLASVQTAHFAERLFAAAGLDLAALVKAGDDTALAAHLESVRVAAAQTAPKITAEHPEVAALITAALAPLQATIREHGLRLTAINGAIAGAGIQLADDAKPEEVAGSFSAAIKAHVAKEAASLLAAKGFGTAAIADAGAVADPSAPAAKPVDPKLTGLARAIAAQKAINAAATL